jgi:hypothetical protein
MSTQLIGVLTPFKRLVAGNRFTYKGDRYRKIDAKRAFKLKPNGVGETHTKIRFARSTNVEL